MKLLKPREVSWLLLVLGLVLIALGLFGRHATAKPCRSRRSARARRATPNPAVLCADA